MRTGRSFTQNEHHALGAYLYMFTAQLNLSEWLKLIMSNPFWARVTQLVNELLSHMLMVYE